MTAPDSQSTNSMGNRAIIVLGMHRSGTSALAGTLEQAGLSLGKVMTHSFDNIKGSRENKRIQFLHEDLLNRAGGSWMKTDVDIKWQPVHKALRDSIVDSFAAESVWGFKDPRTLFTINGWREVLPTVDCVATFRHPFFVAASLNKRNNMAFNDALGIWNAYNSKLLSIFNQSGAFPLIEFKPHDADYQANLKSIIEVLGLNSSAVDFIDPQLAQSEMPDLNAEPLAKISLDIYNQLLTQSRSALQHAA